MKRPLDVTSLEIRCMQDGSTAVQVWCKCHSQEQIDDIIGFLELAKRVVIGWEEVITGVDLTPMELRERGAKGGRARAAALSPARRSEIATGAAEARWSKEDHT
jgi:hypothetical protein